MEDWTTVRYGRRRKPQQSSRDWGYGRPSGWRASAPSLPYRRKFFPHPNQPAPPPRATWFSGPRYRSYADVVRQGVFQPARSRFPARSGEPEVRRQAADPTFGRLIRKIYAVTKTVHHLQNVAPKPGKEEPRMITRMVEVLSGMIKPAAPTRRTSDLIAGNAMNWGHNTCLILMEHYEHGLEEFLEDLTGFLTPDWKRAFEVAVSTDGGSEPNRGSRTTNRDGITQTRDPPQEQRQTRDPTQDQPQTQDPTGAPRRQNATPARTQDRPQRRSAATNTEDQDQCPQDQQEWFQVASSSRSTTEDSPQDRREIRGRCRRTRGTVLTEDSIVADPEPIHRDGERNTSTHHSPTHSELEALFDELHREEEEAGAGALTPQDGLGTTVAQVHQELDEEDDEFVDSPDHFVQRGPPRFRVFRHPRTQRKLTDWNLDVFKKWLIVGDSNLATFPEFFNRNLQVECFPGSHFRHAQALMEKMEPPQDLVVEKIILSFGINGRGNKCQETTIRNVQGALRSTKRRFPYADIWIPLINFSSALPQEEKDNLQELNDHLERNMPFIPLLPERQFATEADDIHWTEETGKAMFDHWLSFLNARSP
ncbi:hypothetical protein D5F01_LYC20134 [Larimichthys crocea]|uniref:Uncharacterized protein n=1 Tax=Larimichthys crocea TaxID=215358 RepID=A0A6G0HPR0_LARCR|nr:hypothetical protein D5F01_LYC20134 [Larimichthys crocea]